MAETLVGEIAETEAWPLRLRPASIHEDQDFLDTDTLHIEFRAAEVAETKDLDENTILDVDRSGNICGITIEWNGCRYKKMNVPFSVPSHGAQEPEGIVLGYRQREVAGFLVPAGKQP